MFSEATSKEVIVFLDKNCRNCKHLISESEGDKINCAFPGNEKITVTVFKKANKGYPSYMWHCAAKTNK